MTLWVRLFLYVLAGWLAARSVPADITEMLKDPLVIDEFSAMASGVVFAISKTWHSIAKRYGWPT